MAKSDRRWEGLFAFKYILVIIDLVGLAEWLRIERVAMYYLLYIYMYEKDLIFYHLAP